MIDIIRPFAGFDYVSEENPTIDVNPIDRGKTWVNVTTGEVFVCADDTVGVNVWVGQLGNVVLYGAIETDPYYSSVSLLVPMNGINGGSVFVDWSSYTKVISPIGNINTSPLEYKFYNSSGVFLSTISYLDIPYHADFILGTEDFTIEAWVFPTESVGEIFQIFCCGYRDTSSGYGGYSFRLGVDSIVFESIHIGSAIASIGYSPISINTWSHIAISRDSSGLKMFNNGIFISPTEDLIGEDVTTYSTDNPVTIGASGNHSNRALWGSSGNIQDVRVTKGVCRYSSNFQPPNRLIANVDLGG